MTSGKIRMFSFLFSIQHWKIILTFVSKLREKELKRFLLFEGFCSNQLTNQTRNDRH